MKNKLLTVIIILGIAALIYNNKSSYIEKQRDRRELENNIEDVTGLDLDLRKFFKTGDKLSEDFTKLSDDKLGDLKNKLEDLSHDELEALSQLLDDKGDEMESLFQDFVEDMTTGDKD